MKILILSFIAIILRGYIETPNFAPMGALAIAASYYFKSKINAALVFFTILFASDLTIQTYDLQLMLMVYMSYIGYIISRSPLIGSFVFFLLSNTAVYFTSTYYNNPLEAIIAGLPFYKYTLISDLFFWHTYGAIDRWQSPSRDGWFTISKTACSRLRCIVLFIVLFWIL